MNREEHLKLMEQKMKENLELARAKNQDYCGEKESSDPFGNFRLANILSNGRISVEDSIFTRLTDKVARIGVLLGQDAKVKSESLQDALKDLSNYSLILSNYLDSRQIAPENTNEVEHERFSAGQEVKILKSCGAPKDLVGTKGMIDRIIEDGLVVKFWHGEKWWYDFDAVESVS